MAEIYVDVDAAVTVPVNTAPLIDDTDFKTRETGVVYNAAGMDLVWNFITTAGVITQTAVTPTTAGVYDWSEIGDAMYKIEIPASGGGSINNDTEGTGWFSGVITGILPFVGPKVTFRPATLNALLVDDTPSTTRGLAGTALPNAAADAAGGLVISDAGGLDIDGLVTTIGTPADTDIATDIANVDSKVSNIASGGGGLKKKAGSFTLTDGVETNTYTSTQAVGGTYHTLDTPTPNLDGYYEFDLGVNGVGTEIIWQGFVGNNGDKVEVYGYDWGSTSFSQIGEILGKNANDVESKTFDLEVGMTGTGANAGKVRFQVASSGGDVAVDINTDYLLCEYTSIAAEAFILHSGIAQAGGSNAITLDSGANANNDFYNHARVVIKSGTGEEQERIIVEYNGTTKVATISPPWTTNPDSTSAFDIEAATVHAETDHSTVKVGTAQAGGATSITLDTGASAINDFYKGDSVEIHSGTGVGQSRIIVDYNGTTKVATVNRAWITNPDSTSEYFIQEAEVDLGAVAGETANASATVDFDDVAEILVDTGTTLPANIAGYVWDALLSSHNIAGSAGKFLRQIKEAVVSTEASVNDASATTTSFITDLTETSDSHYSDLTVVFIDGNLVGQSRPIESYNGTSKTLTFESVEPWSEAPANGDSFIITTTHVHTVTQIADAVVASTLASDVVDLINANDDPVQRPPGRVKLGWHFDTLDRSKILKTGDVQADYGDTITKWISSNGEWTLTAVGSPVLTWNEVLGKPEITLDGASGFEYTSANGLEPTTSGSFACGFRRAAGEYGTTMSLGGVFSTATTTINLWFGAVQATAARGTAYVGVYHNTASGVDTYCSLDGAGRAGAYSNIICASSGSAYTWFSKGKLGTSGSNDNGNWIVDQPSWTYDTLAIGFRASSGGNSQFFKGAITHWGLYEESSDADMILLADYHDSNYKAIHALLLGDSRFNDDATFVGVEASNTAQVNYREKSTGGNNVAAIEAEWVAVEPNGEWDYVVVLGGVNDTISGTAADTVVTSMDSLLTLLTASDSCDTIAICNETPAGQNVSFTSAELYQHSLYSQWLTTEGSTRADAVSIDTWGTLEDPASLGDLLAAYDSGDGLHPSDPAGHNALGAAIAAACTRTDSTSLHAKIDTIDSNLGLTLADTGEMQADQADGGRLDLIWDAIKVKTDELTFTTPNLVDSSATVTGGDATEAKQDIIIAKFTPVAAVPTAQPTSSTLNLVREDAYDDSAQDALTWTASKSVTGEDIYFTIRDMAGAIVLDHDTTGVTASASGTTITVALTAAATALLDPCEYKFDVVVRYSATSRWTVANGIVSVSENQSEE